MTRRDGHADRLTRRRQVTVALRSSPKDPAQHPQQQKRSADHNGDEDRQRKGAASGNHKPSLAMAGAALALVV
jgi:hypothetical protein